jgi:hypothetical protein
VAELNYQSCHMVLVASLVALSMGAALGMSLGAALALVVLILAGDDP